MFKNILLFSIIFGLFISCNSQNNVSKKDVDAFMEGYFEKVKQNNFYLIESYYSDEFYKTTDKNNWEDLYSKIHLALGKLISIELESWNIQSTISTSGSGRSFTFVYNNTYENGKAKETINIFVPRGSDDIKIIGHNYNSNVFLIF
ncbi:MAG: hypothetical protein FWD47_08865 [Treponema sp.]|nr:hypothetical protein [Treponema sp.]